MKEKIKKFIFESTKNSRITTKELGKKTGMSQQSASYIKSQMVSKKQLNPTTIIDAIKLGYVNVLVGFNFINPENSLKKKVISGLKENPSIILVEECKEGIDLLVIYSTLNLSAFNKVHTEIIQEYYQKIKTNFVCPVIVTHEYRKNYLIKKLDDKDIILFGDRTLREISKNEEKVLNELIKKPNKKLIDISTSLKIQVKSVIKLKKSLEKKFIIKGYSNILDNTTLEIERQIIFLRFSGEGIKLIDKFLEFSRYNKNIVECTKLIGEYQITIAIENINNIDVLKKIRSEFPIESYQIFKSEKIHKKQYMPEIK